MPASCLNPIIQVASCRGTLINLIDSIKNLPTLYRLRGSRRLPAKPQWHHIHRHDLRHHFGNSLHRSPQARKVIFDVRNDYDALFHHFQISLQGVQDLQLMELAARGKNRRSLAGLAKCIHNDSPISKAEKMKWDQLKKSAICLFEPEKGGRYEVFNERPFRGGILKYCAGDVAILPGLCDVHDKKLTAEWRDRSASYEPNGPNKGLGPWKSLSELPMSFFDRD
ncbi:hypothetical protein E4U44_008484 [Claviceps purpurea]|nr:hypothetical protein E4U44_008484 [Claviceps purpurea]